MLDSQRTTISYDVGLLSRREWDEGLGLTAGAEEMIEDIWKG